MNAPSPFLQERSQHTLECNTSLDTLFENALKTGPICTNLISGHSFGDIASETPTLFAIPLEGKVTVTVQGEDFTLSPLQNAALPFADWEEVSIPAYRQCQSLFIAVSTTEFEIRTWTGSELTPRLKTYNPQASLTQDLLEQISRSPINSEISKVFLRALIALGWQTWKQQADRKLQSDSQLICLCKRKISEQLLDSTLSVKKLAVQLHRSPSYLSRIFSLQTGKPIIHYIRELRLQRARSFLTSSMEDVSVISWKCGFSSPSYFIRTFKKAEGMPPNSYRRLFSTM